MSSKFSRFNKGFTLVELLVVIAIIGILVGMLLPAIQAAREQARRTSCLNKIRNVALACVSYESSNQQFPAAVSNRDESFLVRILPMIEQGGLYDTFRADNSSTNLLVALDTLSGNQIDTFICDSTSSSEATASNFSNEFTSHYASSAGPVSLDTSGPYTVANGFARNINDNGLIGLRGLFSPTNSGTPFAGATKSGVRTSDVRDGMSNTLAITESSRSVFDNDNADQTFSIRRPRWAVGTESSGGSRLNFARAIAREINTFDVLDDNGDSTPQPHHELCISSNHPGGANVANGDGSTHFVSEDTALVVLQAVAGIDEGDVANQNLDF